MGRRWWWKTPDRVPGIRRKLVVGGLALLAIPTALWIGMAIAIHYHRWLRGPPPPAVPGEHGELRGLSRALAIEATWQSLLLLALWLGGWWLLYVRGTEQPLWANQRALMMLALFAVLTGVVTAWAMSGMATDGF